MAVSSFSQETKDKAAEVKACAASANAATGTVQELASSVAQTLQDVASEVSHQAQDWASNVANKAQETASAAVDKTNDGIAAVGHQLNALGGTVRKAAPQDGVIGSAATTVADNLQAGGRYLEFWADVPP
jgi:ABC-type transporter Mla subunit MlaD